jgi:iron-sulfur cluster assembly protein
MEIRSAPTAKREEPAPGDKPDQAGAQPEATLKIDATETALAQIANLAAKRKAEGKPTLGLRVGLRGGGCDGFSYTFEWADKAAEARDRVFEFAAPDGSAVQIFIDKKSLLYLNGTTLNFVTGLMGHGFKFENPNVKGSCGCGESVHF